MHAACVKITHFGITALCRITIYFPRFGGTSCLHVHDDGDLIPHGV